MILTIQLLYNYFLLGKTPEAALYTWLYCASSAGRTLALACHFPTLRLQLGNRSAHSSLKTNEETLIIFIIFFFSDNLEVQNLCKMPPCMVSFYFANIDL